MHIHNTDDQRKYKISLHRHQTIQIPSVTSLHAAIIFFVNEQRRFYELPQSTLRTLAVKSTNGWRAFFHVYVPQKTQSTVLFRVLISRLTRFPQVLHFK